MKNLFARFMGICAVLTAVAVLWPLFVVMFIRWLHFWAGVFGVTL